MLPKLLVLACVYTSFKPSIVQAFAPFLSTKKVITDIIATTTQLFQMNTAQQQERRVIILVDPVTEWKPVVEAALRSDLVCVAVQLSPISDGMKRFFPTSSGLKEAGVSHVFDRQDRDVFACAQELRQQCYDSTTTTTEEKEGDQHGNMKICAIIPLAETAVDFSDTLAALLGLENHNPLSTVLRKRDKGFMKEAVQSRGLRVAKFSRINDPSQVVSSIQRLGLTYPVVVKTPQGFSTSDVFICETLEEAETAVEQILSRPGPDGRTASCALLEEYIHGIEFAVNLMATQKPSTTTPDAQRSTQTIDFDFVVTDIWKYDKTDQARYNGAENCNPKDPCLQTIVEYAKGVAKAVGIQYGAAHVELKAPVLKTDNSYGDPVMMEVGARLSGGRKATLTQAAYQGAWDPFDALIQSHCGSLEGSKVLDQPPSLYVRHLFLPILRSGRIRRICSCLPPDVVVVTADDIGKEIPQQEPTAADTLSTLHSFVFLVKEGDTVTETKDITSCAGFVWLVGNKAEVNKDADRVLSSFELQID